MISVELTSSKYPRISYCGFKFFIDNDVIDYRFGAPCFPCELVKKKTLNLFCS
jgi:hypothetical protein